MSDPISTANDSLSLLQSCWTVEGESPTSSSNMVIRSETTYSGESPDDGSGEAAAISTSGDFVEYEFTPDYTIPASDFEIWARDEAPGPDSRPEVTVTFDGEEVLVVPSNDSSGGINLSWTDLSGGPYGNDAWSPSSDVDTTTHTIRAEVTQSATDPYVFDVVAPLDGRLEYTFDETVTTVNGDNYLDGPELYPDEVTVAFGSNTTRRDVTTVFVTSTWDNTDGNQAIEVSDDGSTWTTVSNSSTAEVDYPDGTTEVFVRFVLSRYPIGTNPQNATPRFGYNGQSVDDYELEVDVTAILPSDVGTATVDSTVPENEITGEILTEAGQLNNNGVTLTRSTFAEFEVLQNMQVISSENISFNNP